MRFPRTRVGSKSSDSICVRVAKRRPLQSRGNGQGFLRLDEAREVLRGACTGVWPCPLLDCGLQAPRAVRVTVFKPPKVWRFVRAAPDTAGGTTELLSLSHAPSGPSSRPLSPPRGRGGSGGPCTIHPELTCHSRGTPLSPGLAWSTRPAFPVSQRPSS